MSRQEELILLSAHYLGKKSCLIHIREYLIESTKTEWSISSVYVPLNRLEKLGYLKTELGDPSSKRGGKAIKYYFLTKLGEKALSEIKAIQDLMWKNAGSLIPTR